MILLISPENIVWLNFGERKPMPFGIETRKDKDDPIYNLGEPPLQNLITKVHQKGLFFCHSQTKPNEHTQQ